MSSWSEIQKLAADLQRIQFSDSSKKLSDANCIEVVSKLISKSLIDVVFTRDGRSYVTKKHLETELKNEVEAAGDRVSLTDIAAALNIDYNHVDQTAKLLTENGYILRNGELFAQEYVSKLRRQLDKLLLQEGCRTISFLCKHWDLSQDLLKTLLLENISDADGLLVDDDTIYTQSYLQRHNNILCAILLPLTQPTPIAYVIQQVGLPQKRFWASYDELMQKGEISGRLFGSRTSQLCSFVPTRYDTAVKKYAITHFKEKEYLGLSTLRKLGLTDTVQSIRDVLETEDIELLPTVVLTRTLLEHLISSVKENISSNNGVCDVHTALQGNEVPLEAEDIEIICNNTTKQDSNLRNSSGFVYSSYFLKKILVELGDTVEKKAQDEFQRLEKEKKQKGSTLPKKVVDADEDWSDNKKSKKKGGKANSAKGGKSKNDDEKIGGALPVINIETIEQWLENIEFVPEELVNVVADSIHHEINDKLHTRLTELMTAVITGNAQSEKKKISLLHSKASTLYESFCSLGASTSKFSSASLSNDLNAHIIKTVGGQLAATILAYVSGVDDVEKMSEKQRNEVINSLPSECKETVTELYDAVKSLDLDMFHNAVEKLSKRNECDLRPTSEKNMAVWVNNYIAELKSAVESNADPAAILLSCVLLLLAKSGKPTSASGKFVQRLIGELAESIPKTLHELLVSCQQGVVNCIKNKDDDVAKEMLNQDIKQLCEAVLSE